MTSPKKLTKLPSGRLHKLTPEQRERWKQRNKEQRKAQQAAALKKQTKYRPFVPKPTYGDFDPEYRTDRNLGAKS